MSDLVRAGSLGKGGLGGVGRQTRIEKPRPLKMSGGTQPELRAEDLVVVAETVTRALTARQYGDLLVNQIISLCVNLKRNGAQLENTHKDSMDRLLSSMVAACRDDNLDLVCRVHMLEIIELRSMSWQTNENVTNYYKQKLAQIDSPPAKPQTAPVQLNPTAPDFTPEKKDVFFSNQLCKDSNKRSLENVPQLPPHRTPRSHKNSAPRPLLSGGGDSQTDLAPAPPSSATYETSAKVTVGEHTLSISGTSPDLVRTAKVVLHEFFNVVSGPQLSPPVTVVGGAEDANMESPPPERERRLQTGARSKNSSGESSASSCTPTAGDCVAGEQQEQEGPPLVLVKPELSYNKCELLQLAKSPLCRVTPDRWQQLVADLPGVVRRADRLVLAWLLHPSHTDLLRAGPTSKLILREMEEIRRQEAAPKFQ